MNNIKSEKKLYTAQEVADELGVHINTVYLFIKHGKMRATKIGRKLYITAKEWERIINGDIDQNS